MSITAIYIRRSSGTEDDSTSPEVQEEQCRALAEQLGLPDPVLYGEGIRSGVNTVDRPVMTRLLADIEAGKVTTAIAYRWSRMSRDTWDGLTIFGRSVTAGCAWKFVHGGLPPGLEGGPMAAIFYAMQSGQSHEERKSILRHTGDGWEKRLERGGRRNGRKPPYGWKRVDLDKGPDGKKRPGWTLEQVPAQAAVVREMYERMAAGSSLRQVVRWLQQSNHPTPSGLPPGKWSDPAIKNILGDPINYGRVVTNRFRHVKGTGSSQLRPESDWRDLPNAEPIEPIVDGATYRAATVGFTTNGKRSGGVKSSDNTGLLSYGSARCACPGGLHALHWRPDKGGRYKTDQKNADRYGCPQQSISAPALDADVWTRVLAVAADPEVLIKELAEQVAGDPAVEELKVAKARLRKLRSAEQNWADAIEVAESPAAVTLLTAKLDKASAEREAAEEAVRDLASRASRASRAGEWLDGARGLFDELRAKRDELESLDLDGKRAILDRLAVRVTVRPKKMTPNGEDRYDVDIGIGPSTQRDLPRLFEPWPYDYDLPPLTWEGIETEEAYDRLLETADWGEFDPSDTDIDILYRQYGTKPGTKTGNEVDKNGTLTDTGGDEGATNPGTDRQSTPA